MTASGDDKPGSGGLPGTRRTGTVFRYAPPKAGEQQGHYVVRCSAPDGSRPLFHLDPSPESEEHRAAALATAADITAELWARGLGAVRQRAGAARAKREDGDDGAAWFAAWLADRKRRGLVGHVSSDINTYIEPIIGKHPRDWTADDLRGLCRVLDAKVQAGEIAWKTAVNVWGTATRIAKDACRSKIDALRVRDDDPAAGVAGPDRGAKKAKQYLYPSEFQRFVACPIVPIAWRRAAAVAVYLYPRPAELRGLSLADDVDMEHGVVHIHRSLDGKQNAKPTKTKTPRRFTMEPQIVPVLRALAQQGAEHVDIPVQEQNLADAFRRMLWRAGVRRAELHETTATRKAITFYDLRATGITWMAIRGDEPLRIMQRAGHTDFKTTLGYIREAEAIRDGFGDVFPALPESLLKPAAEALSQALAQELPQVAQVLENTVRRRGLEPPWE